MNFHTVQLSPASYYFVPHRIKYLPQHPNPGHPQPVFSLMWETKFRIYIEQQQQQQQHYSRTFSSLRILDSKQRDENSRTNGSKHPPNLICSSFLQTRSFYLILSLQDANIHIHVLMFCMHFLSIFQLSIFHYTPLLVGRSRDRFPVVSLGIFSKGLDGTMFPWSQLSLWKWVPGISPGVKAAGA